MRDGFFYSYRAADVNPLVLECRSRSICHGRKNKQKQKHSHGRTRNFTEGRISRSGSICHGMTRKNTEGKHFFQSRMRKRRILKEAKYFYREDAKTAKRQKGRSKKHFSHGISRKEEGRRKQKQKTNTERRTHLSEPEV